MGQRCLGCEAPQGLWLTGADKCLQERASCTDTQPRSFMTAPNPESCFAVFLTTTPQPSTTPVGHLASARPAPGDTDTRPQVATRTRSSLAHPGPSPTLKQRRVFYGCHHARLQPLAWQRAATVSGAVDTLQAGQSPLQGREPQKDRALGFLFLQGFLLRPDREQQFLQHFLWSLSQQPSPWQTC